jgi:transketolase
MKNPAYTTTRHERLNREFFADEDYAIRQGILKLLEAMCTPGRIGPGCPFASILNGHPGPILPGVHIATGPMGQGFGVAQGFAIAGRSNPRFDSYCMTGDGELQEGPIWEAVMYAGQHHLDNLCVLVDRNNGQLDLHTRLIFPMPELETVFRSFGWQAHNVDATQYDGVVAALEKFRFAPRNGMPTAIICNSSKGFGSFSDFLNKHKVTMPESLIAQEYALQSEQRQARIDEFFVYCERLVGARKGKQSEACCSKRLNACISRLPAELSRGWLDRYLRHGFLLATSASLLTPICCRSSIPKKNMRPPTS